MSKSSSTSLWLSESGKLFICTVGICGCYLMYGRIQEEFFLDGDTNDTNNSSIGATFVLLIQCGFNAIVARILILVAASKSENRIIERLDHVTLLQTSFCFTCAMICSNEALWYVSYPTAVLAKSCKLVPTLLVQTFYSSNTTPNISSNSTQRPPIEKKQDWRGVVILTLGVLGFNLSRLSTDNRSNSNDDMDPPHRSDSWWGIFLLAISLLMDGYLALYQSKLKNPQNTIQVNEQQKEKPLVHFRTPTALETMFWSNAYAIIFFAPLAVIMGQWSSGISLLFSSSSKQRILLWKSIVLLNIAASAGQIFIHYTLFWFSPVICSTITTTRKFVTILLSVYKFNHHISVTQWICIMMVFTGLYFEIGTKFQRNKTALVKRKDTKQT